MMEAFFGFKKTPFGDRPDPKQLFPSQAWNQAKARLQFLAEHHGAGLLTGEVGAGKSTAARTFTASLNPNLYKVLYLHWTPGSTLDLLRQLAQELDLEPAHYRGDLVRQISGAIVRSASASPCNIIWKVSRAKNSTAISRSNSRPRAHPSRCLTTSPAKPSIKRLKVFSARSISWP
jgi:hypothetical protein